MTCDPTRTYSLAPLLEIAGVEQFKIRWPTDADVIAIGLSLEAQRCLSENSNPPPHRFYAALLEILGNIGRAEAQRIALAHGDALVALFGQAFARMRAQLPEGDPRLAEPIPAALARGAA